MLGMRMKVRSSSKKRLSFWVMYSTRVGTVSVCQVCGLQQIGAEYKGGRNLISGIR